MELTLYVGSTKLDINNSTFEINSSYFNPLTFEDGSRKYTSSIELPLSCNNDKVFYAYRYPNFESRKKIIISAFIDGVKIDSFRCSVEVKSDSYIISLLPKNRSIKEDDVQIELGNHVEDYYENGDRSLVNVDKLIRRYYSDISIDLVDAKKTVITTESNYIKKEVKDYRFNWSNSVTGINGEPIRLNNFIKPDDDGLSKHFARPDETRTANLRDCGYIYIPITFNANIHSVSIAAASKMYAAQYMGTEGGYHKYKVSDMYFTYSPSDPAIFRIDIRRNDTGEYVDVAGILINMLPTITLSGSDDILIDNRIPIKTAYELLTGYARINLMTIVEINGTLSLKDMLTHNSVDWSDKFVSLQSIKEADGAAEKKIFTFGNIQVYPTDESIINSTSDIDAGFPLSIDKSNSTTCVYEQSPSPALTDYYNSEEYSFFIRFWYAYFMDQLEYEIEMNITLFDLLEFDSSKRVWIDEFSSYFYVLEISGWSTKSGNCKVKLLKLK